VGITWIWHPPDRVSHRLFFFGYYLAYFELKDIDQDMNRLLADEISVATLRK
jgi:hypothetical protein